MKMAKVIQDGGSQAVRLPKEYHFDTEEVFVKRIGDAVMIIPMDSDGVRIMAAAMMGFTDDFVAVQE